MESNIIESFDKISLECFKNLTYLSLKSNSLKSFKEEKFKNLINLEYLDISNIGLRVMCKFNYLKKLNQTKAFKNFTLSIISFLVCFKKISFLNNHM